MKLVILIVAAGAGSRFGGEIPKPYNLLAGKAVLRHAIEAFSGYHTQLVIHPDHEAHYKEAVKGLSMPKPVYGGATRQESVLRGLEALAAQNPTHVLIHDAARPLVSRTMISRVLESLNPHKAVIPVLPVVDTLRNEKGTVSREGLYRVQTPQGFEFNTILDLHQKYKGKEFTDDAALCEQAGIPVHRVEGEERAMKITTPEDMQRAEAFMQHDTITAQGFDVHRFVEVSHESRVMSHVMICGVPIPHSKSLEGHSDADVGLHALVDALLGTIAAGDIGQHFPCDDLKWKGAESGQFVTHAKKLVEERGGCIVHVDLTILCEKPKISPHRDAMRARIAALLEIPVARVSVKATTTEKLGFTGREEGIAAQAVATVKLPTA